MNKKDIQGKYRCNKDYTQDKVMQLEDELKDLIFKYIKDLNYSDVLYNITKSVTVIMYNLSYTENEALKLLKVAMKHGFFESIETKKKDVTYRS